MSWEVIIECNRLGPINNTLLFLMVLVRGEFRIKVPAAPGPHEDFLPGVQRDTLSFSVLTLLRERGK